MDQHDFINPFRNGIVGDAWESQTSSDVASIHENVFNACLQAVKSVRGGGGRAGMIVHGAAGSGKTHLIRRLREHLTTHLATPELGQLEQMFAYVRLDTNAQALRRHIRNRVATDLMRTSVAGVSQFELMVIARLMSFRGDDGDLLLWRDFLREAPEELAELVANFASRHDLSTTFTRVLTHLMMQRHRLDVAGWLRGESLPQSAYDRLEIATSEIDDPEQTAMSALNDFAKLAGKDLPLIICFDQVEALQTRVDDTASLFAFGQLVRALSDANPNVLMISCMQSSLFSQLKHALPEYQVGAVEGFPPQSLNPLTISEAELIVAARLRRMTKVIDWPGECHSLWPLCRENIVDWVGPHGTTPRRLLADAATGFDHAFKRSGEADSVQPVVGDPPTSKLAAWLRGQWDRQTDRATQTHTREHSQELIRDSIPALIHLADPGWKLSDERRPGVEFILEGPQREARVAVVNLVNNNYQLPHQLRYVLASTTETAKLQKVVLLRDERLPISKTAATTRDRLDELQKRDAVMHWLAPEAIAAIAAAHQLLAAAKSGDLSFGGATVTFQTVSDWLAANLPKALQDSLDVLTLPGAGHAIESLDVAPLQEILTDRRILRLDDAAAELGQSTEHVAALALSRTDLFGCVSGDPTVLFSIRQNGPC